MKFHTTDDGPKKCVAELRACKYGSEDHFRSFEAAQDHYEKKMRENGASFFTAKTRKVTSRVLHNAQSIVQNMKEMYTEIPVEQAREAIENGFTRFTQSGFLPKGLRPTVKKQGRHIRLDVDGMDTPEVMEHARAKNPEINTPSKARKATAVAAATVAVFSLAACNSNTSSYKDIPKTANQEASAVSLEKINDADTVNLKKEAFSFGDSWEVYADGEKVGDIKGAVIPFLGDTYVMTDNDGNVLGTEAENVKLVGNTANKYDENGKQQGTYEQEVLHLTYNLNMLDSNGTLQGQAKQDFSLTLDGKIRNENDKEIFQYDGKFALLGADITIDRLAQDEDLTFMDAIWMTAITNEAVNTSSSSSSNSRSSRK